MATAAPRYEEWLRPDAIGRLAAAVEDPEPFRERRLESYRLFRELPLEPNPLYRKYGYFAGVDLTGLDPQSEGSPVGLPPAANGSIRMVHDASGTRVAVPEELTRAGVRVRPFEDLWNSEADLLPTFLRGTDRPTDRLSALALALLNRGYRLEIPDGYRTPIRVQDLTIVSRPHEALSIRRSLRAGAGAQLLVTEELFSAPEANGAQRFVASDVDLDIAAGARVAYLGLHAPDARTVAHYHRTATVGADAHVAWIWSGFGGFRTKLRNETTVPGRGGSVDDYQTFYGAGDQAYDSAVNITHVGTDTHGQSITRGVFRDQSRGMSRGLVRIEREARKTISFISEHAMLLSRGARSDTIPILEILCRDVKATHSSSVAPVDPEKIFYLESRGLEPEAAIRMIGEGFLAYVLDRAPVAALRDTLYPMLEARWNGEPIFWEGPRFPALGPLAVTGSDASPEWRFDTKLR